MCGFVNWAGHCVVFMGSTLNPLNPESDQHLISPYTNAAESFIKIMRIKEMISNQRSLFLEITFFNLVSYVLDSSWCQDPSPCLNGNCTDVGDNFTCSCEDGFEGDRCEIGEHHKIKQKFNSLSWFNLFLLTIGNLLESIQTCRCDVF